ncbi:hypothetical protein LOK49_LG05G03655 [Camellia lanceoleosa]|uniref:Uncharacterized protein n=1 Tax=Camellia lanceoleosa TaxID=1840588 RepID=A0ACC0HM38_9ERIC|nr:hypothetical protein LOK49_LG05G03655 [Camellia lanceoleosa]
MRKGLGIGIREKAYSGGGAPGGVTGGGGGSGGGGDDGVAVALVFTAAILRGMCVALLLSVLRLLRQELESPRILIRDEIYCFVLVCSLETLQRAYWVLFSLLQNWIFNPSRFWANFLDDSSRITNVVIKQDNVD